MKIGVNTLLWTAGFDRAHLDLLPRIRDWGFDGVEIARFDWSGFPATEIRGALESAGLECTACSALTGQLSLGSDDAQVRQRSLDFIESAIAGASEMGAKVLAGPFCSAVGYLPGRRRTAEEWKRTVDGFQSLGAALDRSGVTMAIEPLNRFETFFLNTASDAIRLVDEIGHPRIGVLFDTFHANIEEKNPAVAFRSLGARLRHVHASENDRGVPGSGHVDWKGVLSTLSDIGYDEWIVIESFGFAIPEIVAAACIWRDLAPSPDVIASEGVKFLRTLTSTAAPR